MPSLIKKGYLRIELPSRHLKTGKIFPALWTTFVITDPRGGQPTMLAAVIRDISDRKRAEDELRRQAAYLNEAQGISHTGSWSWTPATQNALWSQEVFRILGLGPEKTIPSPATYIERVHPLYRAGAPHRAP